MLGFFYWMSVSGFFEAGSVVSLMLIGMQKQERQPDPVANWNPGYRWNRPSGLLFGLRRSFLSARQGTKSRNLEKAILLS